MRPAARTFGPALEHIRGLGPHEGIVVFQQFDNRLHWIRRPDPGEPAENGLLDGTRVFAAKLGYEYVRRSGVARFADLLRRRAPLGLFRRGERFQ